MIPLSRFSFYWFLIVALILCSSFLQSKESEPLEFSVRPTIVFLGREGYDSPKELLTKIINRAIRIYSRKTNPSATDPFGLYGSETLDPKIEIIVVLEDPNAWVVSFHPKNNGMTVKKDEQGFSCIGNPKDNIIVYLDKETLGAIDCPENGVNYSPQLSGFFLQGIQTDYEDLNEAEEILRKPE